MLTGSTVTKDNGGQTGLFGAGARCTLVAQAVLAARRRGTVSNQTDESGILVGEGTGGWLFDVQEDVA